MRVITLLVLSGLFAGIALAQTDNSVECQTTCEVTSRPNENDDGSWVVHLNNGVSYFYMIQYNAIVVVNMRLQFVVIIDGTNGTLSTLDPNTGFGGIVNLQTNLVYAFYEEFTTWDLSVIADGDYSVIISMIEVISQYTVKVVGDDIDTTQQGYADAIQILRDYSITLDITQWVSYQGQTQVIERLQSSNSKVGEILFQLFQSGQYTVEWGPVMYLVVVTDMYQLDDPLLLQYNQFIVSIVQTMCGKFTAEVMFEYYKIIAMQSQQTIEVTLSQFTHLTWAINGVGTTYETIQLALAAYRSQTVVETHVSTIRVNETSSYIAYNSMSNGTWLFRITYDQQSYVQVTASYYDGFMGIFDPSLDYVMVFTRTSNFAFINYKTGNGLIIDGTTQSATYVIASDDSIQKAFAENRYIDGFKLVQSLAENTKIEDDNSFNATLLFIAVQKQDTDSIQQMLSTEQLQSFNSDFSTFGDLLADIDFGNGNGVNNLVSVMLAGPQTMFFQVGYVAMIQKMYKLKLQGGEFYMTCAAGIWNSIHEEWSTPFFQNIVNVLGMLKPGHSREELLKFLVNFTYMSLGIEPLSDSFIANGSVIYG